MLLRTVMGHLWADHGRAFSHAWGLSWEEKVKSALSLSTSIMSLFSWQKQGSDKREVGKTSWGPE